MVFIPSGVRGEAAVTDPGEPELPQSLSVSTREQGWGAVGTSLNWEITKWESFKKFHQQMELKAGV